MPRRPTSLRAILTAITIAVAVMATGVSMCLVFLTGRLHTASRHLADRVDRVHLIGEARADLLLHGRASDPLLAREIEDGIWEVFDRLSGYPRTAAEARALEEAFVRVRAYFAAAHTPGNDVEIARSLEAAYGTLAALIDNKLEHARQAREEVARWDRIANGLGIGVAAMVLLFAAGFLWWLRTRAFRSLWGLLRSMDKFARGDRRARATESGPAELLALARRFNEMAADLAQQRESQMAFLGAVAHDIRNPLGALKLSMVALQRGAPSPDRVDHFFGVMARQITRIERMLGDLMDTAKIEAGKLSLQLAANDLRELVRAAAELYETSSPLHTLALELPPEPIVVLCDAVRIEQVLGNLLSNAVKYSPQGGAVAVTLSRRGQEAVLSGSDNGLGLTQQDAQKLFEPFRRLVTADSGIPGVGLGLFVVRQIICAHGGEIEVDGKPGSGTTFRLRLPLATASPWPPTDPDQMKSSPPVQLAN